MQKLASIALPSLLATLAFAGCSHEEKPPQTAINRPAEYDPATQATPPQKEAVAKAAEENQGGGLNISPEIMQLCPGIKPPRFGFDSAELRDDWTVALKRLAECMTTGQLKGKSILLTGHTDPRGDDDYNMNLGGRRAESVKQALTTFGAEAAWLSVTSRGEVDATGTDEATWARDRRVDIDLLKTRADAGSSPRK